MSKIVSGLSHNDIQARKIVDYLLASEFSNEAISLDYPDRRCALDTKKYGDVGFKDVPTREMKKNALHTNTPTGAIDGRYEQTVKNSGTIVINVQVTNDDEVKRAQDILREAGAIEILTKDD